MHRFRARCTCTMSEILVAIFLLLCDLQLSLRRQSLFRLHISTQAITFLRHVGQQRGASVSGRNRATASMCRLAAGLTNTPRDDGKERTSRTRVMPLAAAAQRREGLRIRVVDAHGGVASLTSGGIHGGAARPIPVWRRRRPSDQAARRGRLGRDSE
jgi:hypothetical protein